ncbi:MAG: MFS transporter [Beijerinckiaceae bacterium]|nr:MAG: MFS transporter [Beijerinckiaceae bacterium]
MQPTDTAAEQQPLSLALMSILAISTGIIVANLYYAQPLDGLIGTALHLPPWAVGLVMTAMQVGYGLGLVFVVPLGDLLENRRLIVATLLFNAVALFGLTFTTTASAFFVFVLLVGVTSASVQIIIPFAAHLAPARQRGRIIGNVMSGLLLGIMLSRPAASFLAHVAGWRLVFGVSGGLMLALALLLSFALPAFPRHSTLSYFRILRSLGPLLVNVPELRRRGGYQAALFGAFILFWTAVPLFLAGPSFSLTQKGIGLFALVGTGGVFISPIAGRIADRGWIRPATGCAMTMVLAAFGLLAIGGAERSMILLVAGALLLDAGVAFNLILSQRVIYNLAADIRARLNGLFIALFFIGGACGSAIASFSYAFGGWSSTCLAGALLAILALVAYATEFLPSRDCLKAPAAKTEA